MKTRNVLYGLSFVLLLASCSLKQIGNSKFEEKIIGKWDIRSIASSARPDAILIKDFNSMLQTLLINASIEFTADHKFTAQIAGKHYQGNWTVDSKSQKLTLTEKNKEVIYSLKQGNDSEIDLSTRDTNQDLLVQLFRQGH